MTPHARAWECAFALLSISPDLTLRQRIECHVALIAGPDAADLGMIALAAQVLGRRT